MWARLALNMHFSASAWNYRLYITMIFSCSSQGFGEADELSTYLSSETAVRSFSVLRLFFIVLHTKLPDLEWVLKTPGLCVRLGWSHLALQTSVIWTPALWDWWMVFIGAGLWLLFLHYEPLELREPACWEGLPSLHGYPGQGCPREVVAGTGRCDLYQQQSLSHG